MSSTKGQATEHFGVSDENAHPHDHGSSEEEADSNFTEDESDFDSDAEYDKHYHDNDSLPTLPSRLKLPAELELNVLYFASRWGDLWLVYRLVCKAWRDHIESLAPRKWLPRAYLHFPKAPRGQNSIWRFQRLEDDRTAVFADADHAENDRKVLTHECKRIAYPDVVLGHYVFKIKIPGMYFDWEHLTALVPWRSFVTRIFAEENAVDAEIKNGMRAQWRRAARMKRALERGEMDQMDMMRSLISGFGHGLDDAHTTVYKRTWPADPAEVERVKKLRFVAGCDPIDSDDDAREEELRAVGQPSTRESALLLQAHYRRTGMGAF
ncbi:hypothetical protein AURDEDRAFT_151445 [Auricularia subglabra TFB-10046 SS5]|nr:hypothetical protein AURDEDRAFT_151445 [Auricularia subglabra TFB-10046 SS5]